MKYLIINDENMIYEIIKYLISKTELPTIEHRLNIYATDGTDFNIEIVNNKIFFKDGTKSKKIYIKNKNLKHFFKNIHMQKNSPFYINDISLLKFSNCSILFDTYHGNIISFDDEKLLKDVQKKFKLEAFSNINDHNHKKLQEEEYIFDELGNLNSKIKNFSTKTGLDIRSSSSSVRLRISNLSNDYTHIEKYYKLITNSDLLSLYSKPTLEYKFKEMSIIIPVYNQDVTKTLLSIQGQNLSKANKSKIQVILIDDGSDKPLINSLKNIKHKFDFEIDVISFNKNMGLSSARNAGLSIAKHDLFLFIDSDIILSANYLYDVNIRLQIVPNAIFVAMRKNINKKDELIKNSNILKGINNTFDVDDSRVVTKVKDYHIGWDNVFKDDIINILDDTDYFKQLGFGSKIGIYNISSIVTGHNIAINSKLITKCQPFSSKFKGWGMEDSYFASTLIAEGCFVIPLLSSCVFHIDHPPRSGSNEKKFKEANKNFNTYNDLLDENWMDS